MNAPARKPLRLWPGVVLAILLCVAKFVVPAVSSDFLVEGLFGGLICAAAIVIWWLLLSRAPWSERLGAIALMIIAVGATPKILDKSIATGAMGFLFYMLAIPPLALAFVAWAAATSRLSDGIRRATMAATILAATGAWALVRTGGFTASDIKNDLHWRWTPTPEERLVAKSGSELGALPAAPTAAPIVAAPLHADPSPAPVTAKMLPAAVKTSARTLAAKAGTAPVIPTVTAAAETPAVWPGFRGPHRDDVVSGVRIKTDWKASPPQQIWRRPVGPGWSSFAVQGGLIYTQEQRGPDEVVACYRLTTGEPVWAHRDPARFWESNGGPGPRGTPTLSNGRVYTFGATGILNVLNASDGAPVWSRNAAADAGVKTPGWGFAGSPLVIGEMVVVSVRGKLAAYDASAGAPRWFGPDGGDGYSSPQLARIGGAEQIVLMSATGATSVALADGSVLWKYAWPSDTRIMQPAVIDDGSLMITAGDAMGGVGVRRIAVALGPSGWTAEEKWASRGLTPSFNDSVLHNGYAYGFSGSILACIDLKDGQRKWKGGRYGNGQLLLLSDQDLLIVSSEEGELALVKAAPDQFNELARFQAIEGKTWNHPVLAGNVLLDRNGEEMAAFRLPLEDR